MLWRCELPQSIGACTHASVVDGSDGSACVLGTAAGALVVLDMRLGMLSKVLQLCSMESPTLASDCSISCVKPFLSVGASSGSRS